MVANYKKDWLKILQKNCLNYKHPCLINFEHFHEYFGIKENPKEFTEESDLDSLLDEEDLKNDSKLTSKNSKAGNKNKRSPQ